ncbi:MAG: DMT family transporter [Spirochaetes bacterium]|nr:DMT family transporter [Spirochaetota bacterium]
MQFLKKINPYLLLVLGAVIISFSGIFVKLTTVNSIASAFYRVSFGGFAFLIILIITKKKLLIDKKNLFFAALTGLFFAVDLSFWHSSIHYIGPGLATILGNFQVILMALIGILVFKEKITIRFILAVPLAVAGIFLLVGIKWNEFSENYQLGILFGLITAICYTGYLLSLRYAQSHSQKAEVSAFIMWISFFTAIYLSIPSIFQPQPVNFFVLNWQDGMILFIYGVLCQAFGWLIITTALPQIPASRAGLILLLQPALSFIWDMLFLGRPTGIIEIIGATLALGAIYLGSVVKKK